MISSIPWFKSALHFFRKVILICWACFETDNTRLFTYATDSIAQSHWNQQILSQSVNSPTLSLMVQSSRLRTQPTAYMQYVQLLWQ